MNFLSELLKFAVGANQEVVAKILTTANDVWLLLAQLVGQYEEGDTTEKFVSMGYLSLLSLCAGLLVGFVCTMTMQNDGDLVAKELRLVPRSQGGRSRRSSSVSETTESSWPRNRTLRTRDDWGGSYSD
jgi:hypothetical protein